MPRYVVLTKHLCFCGPRKRYSPFSNFAQMNAFQPLSSSKVICNYNSGRSPRCLMATMFFSAGTKRAPNKYTCDRNPSPQLTAGKRAQPERQRLSEETMPGRNRCPKFDWFLHSRNSRTLYSFSYLYSVNNGEGERQKTKHIRHEDNLKLFRSTIWQDSKTAFLKIISTGISSKKLGHEVGERCADSLAKNKKPYLQLKSIRLF